MKYLTGPYALNIIDENNSGDWHPYYEPEYAESDNSPFGTWGITIKNNQPMATHARAALDLIYQGKYAMISGCMREYLINDESQTPEIFNQLLKLQNLPQWPIICEKIAHEYKGDWIRFLKKNKLFRYDIDSQQYTVKNEITVSDIHALAQMKAQALLSRDTARDLYDVCFLCINEYDNLNSFSRFALENALSQKNLQQLDYLAEIEPQVKSGINFKKLETMLLTAMNKMDILTDNPI